MSKYIHSFINEKKGNKIGHGNDSGAVLGTRMEVLVSSILASLTTFNK